MGSANWAACRVEAAAPPKAGRTLGVMRGISRLPTTLGWDGHVEHGRALTMKS